MNALNPKKVEVSEAVDSADVSIPLAPVIKKTVSIPPHMLPEVFDQCWVGIEEGNFGYEAELRRRIEGDPNQFIPSHAAIYLKKLCQKNNFFFSIKGLAIKMVGDVERRWKAKDKSDEENANELRRAVLDIIRPYAECVPLRMRVRARMQLWNSPQPLPEHGTAPAFSFSIDGETGEIHRRFYGTNRHPVPVSPIIPHGLTGILQPFRYGDEAWTQDQGQGGYMFSEDQTLAVNERGERAMAQVSPKPGPR